MPIITVPPRRFANRARLPRDGWKVEKKIDLLSAGGHCQNCGARVRYLFQLRHRDCAEPIYVGSECRKRMTMRWRVSAKGNFWAKYGRRLVTVFQSPFGWKFVAAGVFSGATFDSPDAAKAAAMEAL